MGSVRSGAKQAVIGVVLIAALTWALFFGALLFYVVGLLPAIVLASVAALALVWFFPERLLADNVYGLMVKKGEGAQNQRLRNIADGLAIAIGVPAEQVHVIDSPVPNVLALPTKSHGLVVVATEGAVRLLSRQELEALVASQIVVAGEPWVRHAARAQIAQGPWFILIPMACVVGFPRITFFVLAFAMLFVFAFTAIYRRADAVRDLVADSVAINTTKNPDALVGALRDLRPAVLAAPKQKLGAIGLKIDAFAVLSGRKEVATTVSGNGKSRSWSTEDELATELGFRADRMERVSRGDFTALEGLGPFHKAWKMLGTPDNPYRLTDAERAAGTAAAVGLPVQS
jgi:Zn-dependent protease with chaperone function